MMAWLPTSLLDHLWQSTLFVLLVWLATVALRGNSARVRCWLWTAASVKFLVPVSALVAVGERFRWQEAPAAIERSDVCAVPAAAVVGEAMVAFVVADAFLEKFGGDSIAEIEGHYRATAAEVRARFELARSSRV